MSVSLTCGHCGEGVFAAVLYEVSGSSRICLLRCPKCGDAMVRTQSGAIMPSKPAGGIIPNLPADVDDAWREVRTAYAVAAYTASEMMCRKILMHVAVDVAKIPAGKNYIDYVNELEAQNYLAVGLKPVIDKIRGRGNTANHDLPASTEEEAKVTMAITEYLLRGIYELPAL